MPGPFPGMDPYLENPCLWPTVHQRLITYIADDISLQLPPPYFVLMGERVYIQPSGPRSYRMLSHCGLPLRRLPAEAERLSPTHRFNSPICPSRFGSPLFRSWWTETGSRS